VRDHVVLQSAGATYDLRSGDWKLVERANAPDFESVRNKKKTAAAELYNLKDDPAEKKDVIAANKDSLRS